MKIMTILLLALSLTSLSCTSGGSSSGGNSAQARCTCGTPEADFGGCSNAHCIKGERNPDNPDCVCGPMKIGGK